MFFLGGEGTVENLFRCYFPTLAYVRVCVCVCQYSLCLMVGAVYFFFDNFLPLKRIKEVCVCACECL